MYLAAKINIIIKIIANTCIKRVYSWQQFSPGVWWVCWKSDSEAINFYTGCQGEPLCSGSSQQTYNNNIIFERELRDHQIIIWSWPMVIEPRYYYDVAYYIIMGCQLSLVSSACLSYKATVPMLQHTCSYFSRVPVCSTGDLTAMQHDQWHSGLHPFDQCS